MAECQRGPKVAPRLLLHAPLAPRRFLQGGHAHSRRVFRAISQSVSRGGAAFPFRRPKGGASVVVYIPNGTVWTHRNFVEIFEKTQQVGYRCLPYSPAGVRQSSLFGKIWSPICSPIWSPIGATFGAALALCEIHVSVGIPSFPSPNSFRERAPLLGASGTLPDSRRQLDPCFAPIGPR